MSNLHIGLAIAELRIMAMKFTNNFLLAAAICAAILPTPTKGITLELPQGQADGKQQTKKPAKLKAVKPAETTEQVDPKKLQAINIIESEIDRAKKYNHLNDSIRVWTAAADALWNINPQKSRKLLQETYSRIEEALPPERKDENKFATSARIISLRGQLRSDILAVAARRDPTLIKDLVHTVEEDKNELIANHNEPILFGSSSFQKRSLALLAARLAPTDPKRAVEYATQSLGYGIPEELQDVFRALISVDGGSAHQLFANVTNVFVADTSPNLYDAIILSGYLKWSSKPDSDTALVRRFLQAAFDRISRVQEQSLANGSENEGMNSILVLVINQLQPVCQAYWPEMANSLSALNRQLMTNVRVNSLREEELFPTEESRNDTERILERADKEKNKADRDALYLQAAVALAEKADYPRALEVVARAEDGEKREAVLSYIRRLQVQKLISSGDLYEALKVIDKIDAPEERAEATILFVNAARNKRDTPLALGVLNDTQSFLGGQPGSVSYARAYLWLASSYCTIDKLVGFEIMTAAIKSANKTTDMNELRSEPKLVHLGGSSRQAVRIGESKADFRPGFRILAQADFPRTAMMAESFENQLFRGLSLIATADSILNKADKRSKS